MNSKCFLLLQISFVTLAASQSRFLTVYILPPASSTIYACCWSNSSSSSFAPRNFSYAGEFTWTITNDYSSNYYTAYWCRARLGSNVLTQFPIYGGGVERNSSEWLINSRGRRRLSLNGNFTDDRRGNWQDYILLSIVAQGGYLTMRRL